MRKISKTTALKYISPWTIVRLQDDRLGLVTNNKNKSNILIRFDDYGSFINSDESVEVIIYPAQGMMEILKQLWNKEKGKELNHG